MRERGGTMLRRRIRINAEGKELYRFINGLHGEGVACFGQYCRSDVFYGEIYRRDLKKVRRLAEECGVQLKEAEYRSLMKFLSGYRHRYGIALGVAAAFLGCIYFSQTVVTIEIQGNERISSDSVMSALSELDIRRGSRIGDLDLHYCENELEIMMDDIAWAGIRRTGNRIVVQIKETVEKPEMVHERIPCNIVAAKAAQITAVTVHKGMAMHKAGDFVPEGALLISGIKQTDTGRMTLHHAAGEVTGIYEETAVFTEKYRPLRYVPTGRVEKERRLRLFSVDIPLFFGGNDYENCERDSRLKSFRIMGKELPVGIVTDTITETALTDDTLTDEEMDKMLIEKMYLYEKNFLSGCKIIKRDVKREKNEDSMTFITSYKLEGSICRQKEIFIK